MKKVFSLVSIAALCGLMIGCADPYVAKDVPVVKPFSKLYVPGAKAGIGVTAGTDVTKLKALYASAKRGSPRSNPFMLSKDEISFDLTQSSERLFNESGSFDLTYTPKETNDDKVEVEEAQPYRRLMGIVIGDAVVAILETQGQPTVIIRPGSEIPNTEWKVISIDTEKAVLERKGNAKPKRITVRLENPPPGFNPGGGAGAPGPGGPGGPGGPPGGSGMPFGAQGGSGGRGKSD